MNIIDLSVLIIIGALLAPFVIAVWGKYRPRSGKGEFISVEVWLSGALQRSQHKSFANDLDLPFLLRLYWSQGGKCAITGLPMTSRARDVEAISIDRVDSELGYLKSNVVLACRWANVGRGRYCSIDDFKMILRRV